MTDLKTFFNNLTSLPTENVDEFSELFKPKVLKKGEYFIKEGQIAKELAFLETGVMRVFFRNDEGIEYNKQFFVNPCLVGGYSSLITNQPTGTFFGTQLVLTVVANGWLFGFVFCHIFCVFQRSQSEFYRKNYL
jgi:CRP-like cAMP-binding protein